jgi:hypothetical protein
VPDAAFDPPTAQTVHSAGLVQEAPARVQGGGVRRTWQTPAVFDAADSQDRSGTEPHWAPVSPIAVILPGIVLLFAGLWMVTDNGPLATGWAFFAIGLALLLVGTVARGVAWGLDLHADSRR